MLAGMTLLRALLLSFAFAASAGAASAQCVAPPPAEPGAALEAAVAIQGLTPRARGGANDGQWAGPVPVHCRYGREPRLFPKDWRAS